MKAGSKKLNLSRATNAKSARGGVSKKSQKGAVDAQSMTEMKSPPKTHRLRKALLDVEEEPSHVNDQTYDG